MKRKLCHLSLIIILIGYSQYCNSQTQTNYNIISNYENNKPANKINDIDYSNIEGSPYWNDNFVKCDLIMTNGENIKAVLRYNIFDDAFEIKQRGNIFNLKKDENFKSVTINSKQFCLIKLESESSKTIVEKLYSKELTLFLKHQVIFIKEQVAKPYNDPKPREFKRLKSIVFIKSGNQIIKIKKVKDFSKIFINNSNYIKKYIKKNRIKLNSNKQLIELIQYIESLTLSN